MKKVMLYPFDSASFSILKYKNRLNNLELVDIVSPIGWGYNDVYIKYLVRHDFSNALENCDIVWIVNSQNSISYEYDIRPKIEEAVLKKKEVIVTRDFDEEKKQEIERIIKDNKYKFTNLCQTNSLKCLENLEMDSLFEINCPVIYIVGAMEYTKRYEMLLALGESFKKKNLKTLLFTERQEGTLMGCYDFSYMLKDDKVCEVEKIKNMNWYFKQMERNINPDLIIAMAPGRLLTANSCCIENSIINGYELSYALQPDCIILSIMYTENLENLIPELQERCRRTYGLYADFINVVERMLDESNGESGEGLSYLTLDEKFVTAHIGHIADQVSCLKDNESFEKLAQKVIKRLEGYNDIEII